MGPSVEGPSPPVTANAAAAAAATVTKTATATANCLLILLNLSGVECAFAKAEQTHGAPPIPASPSAGPDAALFAYSRNG